MTKPEGAGAPVQDEIEITPEMIEAGAKLLADFFDQPLDWLTEDRARAVFAAMFACAPMKSVALNRSDWLYSDKS